MSGMDAQRIAHDLDNLKIIRSKDVELAEDLSFKDFELSQETLDGLCHCGFRRPSPIQVETIPLGRCGFDLIIQSKAGTGKTCIFAVIALEALHLNEMKFTQTIVVAPTREVALQIHEVITSIGSVYENLNCAICIGGTEVKSDRAQFKKGPCQIVIGTPGRLKQLLELNILKSHQVELFVLDEADKLMEDQFKNQVDDIYKRLPRDKQMIVTSATYPDELSSFLRNYMHTPKNIRIGNELSLEAVSEFYVESEAGQSNRNNLDSKYEILKSLLCHEEFSKCFIFTNYQSRAPLICDNLNKDEAFLGKFGPTKYICAELTQIERNKVFKTFKNSIQKILVSTDVSARGIDIQDIELVINFDLPSDNATYYHRIGRAGRFGQPGRAISIVSCDIVDRSIFKKSIQSDRITKLGLIERSSRCR